MDELNQKAPTENLNQELGAEEEEHQTLPTSSSDSLGSEIREELQIDFVNGSKISLASLKYDVKELVALAMTMQKDMLNGKTKQKGGTMIG